MFAPRQFAEPPSPVFKHVTSDYMVAGSSPAGCMPQSEALMSNPINARNFTCALLVFFYDSDGRRVVSYNGDTVRIPLGSLEFKKRRCLIPADISTSGRRFRAARFPMQLGRKTSRRLCLPGMGRVGKIRRQRVVAQLDDHYRRSQRTPRPGAPPDARNPP